jgi:hypothetical protein
MLTGASAATASAILAAALIKSVGSVAATNDIHRWHQSTKDVKSRSRALL